jgi:hypothetical protein
MASATIRGSGDAERPLGSSVIAASPRLLVVAMTSRAPDAAPPRLVSTALGVAAAILAALLATMSAALAQQPAADAAADERERAFVEGLRREDPAEADRYVALRDARDQSVAEVQKAQQRYAAAGPELRSLFAQQLRAAQRQYAQSSLALLDFFDARERRALARYQEEIGRINRVLEERGRSRAELEKMLRSE